MTNINEQLALKYNVPVPRYTSYPTMPYWQPAGFNKTLWLKSVKQAFTHSNVTNGISLYIHLPYCESLCTYCGCNTRITKNHAVERPYIDAVLKEWSLYLQAFDGKPIIREIHLGGGTPTFFSAANLQYLMAGMLKGAQIHPLAEFSFEGHPANTTYEHLQTLYNEGFRRLSLGIQDFDPHVQFIINRSQTFEQVLTVTQNARSIGYTSVNYDLIYGLPKQTLNGMVNTINQVTGLSPDRIAFYSYAHVPWVKPGQRHFTENDLPNPELKKQLHSTGRNLLIHYGYEEVGMDHFALPGDSLLQARNTGHLHRNFMGYTHQHTRLLVGLGVSSISDSWHAFAQNVKTVGEYLNMVSKSELPLLKGHIQTPEDLLIRQHILDIMCKGQTCFSLSEPTANIYTDILRRLNSLAVDGLIELDNCDEDYSLKVTPLGKHFLRNICMAFDVRLWADKPATQLFSMAV